MLVADRDVSLILSRYAAQPALYLRDITLAEPGDPAVALALNLLAQIVAALQDGYKAERDDEMPRAEALILQARVTMRAFQAEAERLAQDCGIGIPFFAHWQGPAHAA